jgi:outer membrane protein OmpA-like peptidoglycan-associated protein
VARGVAADRIDAVVLAEERPAASNDTAEGRARDRRAEMTVPRK